jgi:ferredoxin
MAGQRIRKTPVNVPQPWDTILSMQKYIVAIVVLYFAWTTGALIFRAFCPGYALLSRHGYDITIWAYIVSGVLIVLSLFISQPLCRWYCPLATVLNLSAIASRFRIIRDKDTCINCDKCSKACSMAIPVAQSIGESIERCIACTECVGVCPLNTKEKKTLRSSYSQWTVIAVLLICIAASVAFYAMFPLASYTRVRGERPQQVESITLKIDNLDCRGKATRLWFYLDRDDLFALPGYLFLEVWTDQDVATVRVTFEPGQISRDDLCRAITEPYINFADLETPGLIMFSPFNIEGYDPMKFEFEDASPMD